jgi:hypothetical protein
VQDTQYVDAIRSNSPVDDEIWRMRYDEFPCSPHTSAPAEAWMIKKPIYAGLNEIALIQGRLRTFFLQVADDILSIILGCRKPDDDHEAAS